MNQAGSSSAYNGALGYNVAKYSTYIPFFTNGVGFAASSPIKLIPDSFYTNYDTTSSSHNNSVLVNSVIEVGGDKNINLIK